MNGLRSKTGNRLPFPPYTAYNILRKNNSQNQYYSQCIRINFLEAAMKQLLIFGDSILKGVTYVPELGGYHVLRGDRFPKLRERGIEIRNFSRM